MPKLQSLNQPASLAKLAYDAILKSILSNEMHPDEIYNEMMLAKELSISRTPVREALLELSIQGLVTFLPRKGIVVNRFTETDVDEIFEIRRAIDSAAAEKLATIEPAPDIQILQKSLEKQNRAAEKNDLWSYLREDRNFHITLTKITGNNRMVTIAENIRNMVHLMGTQALELPGRTAEVLQEHTRIIDAIVQRNPQQAREAVVDHLLKSEQAVLSTFSLKKIKKEKA